MVNVINGNHEMSNEQVGGHSPAELEAMFDDTPEEAATAAAAERE
jgi:hypothetical protein